MSTRSERRAEERKRVKDAREAKLNLTAGAPVMTEEVAIETELLASAAIPPTDLPKSNFERTLYAIADVAKADEEYASVLMAPADSEPSAPPSPQPQPPSAQQTSPLAVPQAPCRRHLRVAAAPRLPKAKPSRASTPSRPVSPAAPSCFPATMPKPTAIMLLNTSKSGSPAANAKKHLFNLSPTPIGASIVSPVLSMASSPSATSSSPTCSPAKLPACASS